jgi:hypothetical protein
MANLKGTLEVEAVIDSRKGLSEDFVPAGSIGYVLGVHPNGADWLVHWPNAERAYKSDCRTSSHAKITLRPTGNRHP